MHATGRKKTKCRSGGKENGEVRVKWMMREVFLKNRETMEGVRRRGMLQP